VLKKIEESLFKIKENYPDDKTKVIPMNITRYKSKAQEKYDFEKETGIEQNCAIVNLLTTIDCKDRPRDKIPDGWEEGTCF